MTLISTNQTYTYEVLTEDIKRLKKEFSTLTTGTAGVSVLAKPLPFLTLGTGNKKLLLTAAHHGKEWITSMLAMAIVEKMLRMQKENARYGEIAVRDYLATYTLYVLPMVNPDGVNLCTKGLTEDIPVFTRSRLIGMHGGSKDFVGKWQANIRGVDLNHNYDALFEKGKTIAFAEGIYGPGPTRFSGEYAESEPETQAVVAFTKEVAPHIVIAYHSQGEEIFYSFNGVCPKGGKELAEKLAQNTGYRLSEATGVTDCSGFKDWVIDKFSIPAFTIEVGKGENPLPLSQFHKIFQDNFRGLLRL